MSSLLTIITIAISLHKTELKMGDTSIGFSQTYISDTKFANQRIVEKKIKKSTARLLYLTQTLVII